MDVKVYNGEWLQSRGWNGRTTNEKASMHFPYLHCLFFTPPSFFAPRSRFQLSFLYVSGNERTFCKWISPGRRIGSLSAFPCCIKFISVLGTGNLMANALNKPSPRLTATNWFYVWFPYANYVMQLVAYTRNEMVLTFWIDLNARVCGSELL